MPLGQNWVVLKVLAGANSPGAGRRTRMSPSMISYPGGTASAGVISGAQHGGGVARAVRGPASSASIIAPVGTADESKVAFINVLLRRRCLLHRDQDQDQAFAFGERRHRLPDDGALRLAMILHLHPV